MNKLSSLSYQEAVQILEYLQSIGCAAIVRRYFYKNVHRFFCDQKSRVKAVILAVVSENQQHISEIIWKRDSLLKLKQITG